MSVEVLKDELFLMYADAPRSEPVPRLDETQQQAFLRLVDEHGLRMIAGYSSFVKNPNIASMTTSDDMVAPMERFPGSVVGPYFLDGVYFPNALGAWAIVDATEPE